MIPSNKTVPKETTQKLGVKSFPTNLILDKKEKVRYYKVGYDGDIHTELSNILNKLL
ncbi:hypothetical protein [Chondrinema litorale]|uniref:hypothetical protein n=1 Tax=Chondrinema litorale TaxID=2994555 RepID=UPI00254340C6|nr:hypothetical protein [Chondrinema litorale]UZR97692.1 hypothetical protein OQ292_28210 [Chondrinema litorale]